MCRSMIWRSWLVVVLVLAVLSGRTTCAQQESAGPVVLAVDMNLASALDDPFFKMIFHEIPWEYHTLLKASRVYGVSSLPDDSTQMLSTKSGDRIPFQDFLITIEFNNTNDLYAFIPSDLLGSLDKTQRGGISYYVAPGRYSKVLFKVDDCRIDFGTEAYLLSDRSKLLSSKFKSEMAELQKSPVRVALDVEASRPLFDRVVPMIKAQGVSPMVVQSLELLKRVTFLKVGLAPKQSEMFKLSTTSKDSNDANLTSQAFASLVGMIKLTVEREGARMKEHPSQQLAVHLLNAVKVESANQNASLSITKTAETEKLMQAVLDRRN